MPIKFITKGKRGPKPKIKGAARQQVIADYVSGIGPTALAHKHGVSPWTIARITRGHKLGSAVTAPPAVAVAE